MKVNIIPPSEFIIPRRNNREPEIHCRVDANNKIITILSGEVKTKEEFLALAKRFLFFTLLNQIVAEKEGGCVDPFCADFIDLLRSNPDDGYDLADQWYHRFDDYKIVREIK